VLLYFNCMDGCFECYDRNKTHQSSSSRDTLCLLSYFMHVVLIDRVWSNISLSPIQLFLFSHAGN
jgi:hypothetical protein